MDESNEGGWFVSWSEGREGMVDVWRRTNKLMEGGLVCWTSGWVNGWVSGVGGGSGFMGENNEWIE